MRQILSLVSFGLVIIGALNWLLVGVTRFDLVRWLFRRHTTPQRVTYSLVGLAGVTQLVTSIVRAVRGTPSPVTGTA